MGQKFFKTAKEGELLVTSRFFTLQGEGPYRGQPAMFIRLAKCNLACSFCDTYFDSGEVKTFQQILDECDEVRRQWYMEQDMTIPTQKPLLVITGGEPALQNNLTPFLEHAYIQGWDTQQIESNGTLVQDYPIFTTLVVSPKCLEKNGKAVKYLEPRAEMLEAAHCLKFVVCAPDMDQFTPYSEVPGWAQTWAYHTNKEVFVSPMNIYNREPEKAKALRALNKGTTIEQRSEVDERVSFWEKGLFNMEQNQKNHEYAALLCMRYGFTLNLQIHLYANLP